jgi:hypothetical protein
MIERTRGRIIGADLKAYPFHIVLLRPSKEGRENLAGKTAAAMKLRRHDRFTHEQAVVDRSYAMATTQPCSRYAVKAVGTEIAFTILP